METLSDIFSLYLIIFKNLKIESKQGLLLSERKTKFHSKGFQASMCVSTYHIVGYFGSMQI